MVHNEVEVERLRVGGSSQDNFTRNLCEVEHLFNWLSVSIIDVFIFFYFFAFLGCSVLRWLSNWRVSVIIEADESALVKLVISRSFGSFIEGLVRLGLSYTFSRRILSQVSRLVNRLGLLKSDTLL